MSRAIAYLGLGLMGLPMAKRLISLGYCVTAYAASKSQLYDRD